MAVRQAAELEMSASYSGNAENASIEELEVALDAAASEASNGCLAFIGGHDEQVRQGDEDSAASTDALRSIEGTDIPLPPQRQPALLTFQKSHSQWFVRITMGLVALLHAKHRVSFRACNLILFSFAKIFSGLGVLSALDPMPQTLGSVLKRLDLEDRFRLYPICASCHRIFQIGIPISSVCPDCSQPLFKPVSSSLFQRLTGKPVPPLSPNAAAPIQTLSSLLVDFLARPEIESNINGWRTQEHKIGHYADISDGTVWRTLRGPDSKLFFSPTDNQPTISELRIGVTLAFDWYGNEMLSLRSS